MFGHQPQHHLEIFNVSGKRVFNEYFTFTDSVMNFAWSWRRSDSHARIMIDDEERCKVIYPKEVFPDAR